jgi:hypothetical protein
MAIGVSLMLFSRLCRGMPTGLQVSKTLAYRSIVIAAVGIYLIGLGLAGEGMRYLGASSQRLFAAIALLGGVALCRSAFGDVAAQGKGLSAQEFL